MTAQKAYHIIGLQVENIKKIKAVEIKPDGEMVILKGKNGAGKTSVLDSILWALTGGKSIQSEPIAHDQDHAKIRLDLGDFIVERYFKRTEDSFTTSLKVLTPDGAMHGRPQEFLSERLGQITFDPIAFTNMKVADQVAQLKTISGLGDSLEKLEAVEKALVESRRLANAEEKRLLAAGQSLAEGLPPERPTVPNVDELMAIVDKGSGRDQIQNRIDQHTFKINDQRSRITMLQKEIKGCELEIESSENFIAVFKTELSKLPNEEEIQIARNMVAQSQGTAATLAKFDNLDQTRAQWKEAAARAKNSDEKVEAARADIRKLVDSAKMPVEGLEIKDGQIVYNGTPYGQCSNGDQIRVAVAIAMAANPQIRIVQIRSGSLMDSDNMALVEELARKYNFQAWVERVAAAGEVGFEITDGALVAPAEKKQVAA